MSVLFLGPILKNNWSNVFDIVRCCCRIRTSHRILDNIPLGDDILGEKVPKACVQTLSRNRVPNMSLPTYSKHIISAHTLSAFPFYRSFYQCPVFVSCLCARVLSFPSRCIYILLPKSLFSVLSSWLLACTPHLPGQHRNVTMTARTRAPLGEAQSHDLLLEFPIWPMALRGRYSDLSGIMAIPTLLFEHAMTTSCSYATAGG